MKDGRSIKTVMKSTDITCAFLLGDRNLISDIDSVYPSGIEFKMMNTQCTHLSLACKLR